MCVSPNQEWVDRAVLAIFLNAFKNIVLFQKEPYFDRIRLPLNTLYLNGHVLFGFSNRGLGLIKKGRLGWVTPKEFFSL